MKTAEIRERFLRFFERNGHRIVESSSLVPSDDPTLLFTNAGMNQFKDVFLGKEPRDYTRATTAQKCVRAGGKHNDLENVGYTARHHTFFEMLGNFSFGDYFKEDAIRFAWEFLTKELGIPAEKLWVTVYKDDVEAEKIWFNKIGIDQKRFSRLGEKDNFWAMGDTGPCGPCTEIFYDHGASVAGDPPGGPNDDGDRYIEVWNLVFMQYNRLADGTLESLPKPSVDTGMGLERISAVMQHVHSNYEIDLFQAILASASALLGGVSTEEKSLRVIADHIRSASFLIADGVSPSNESRGYTLRRIIRRAIRHGNRLGADGVFFYKLVPALIEAMGTAYPELARNKNVIETQLKQEEEQFAKTLEKGMRVLEQDLGKMSGTVIPGITVFTLYDTYGFPVDLTNDIARERGLTLDYAGYDAEMEKQRERARASSSFGVDYNASLKLEGATEFSGYSALEGKAVVRWVRNIDGSEALKAGEQAIIVLDRTPFYAESGGQAGDTGRIFWADGEFHVSDTKKDGQHFVHVGTLVKGSVNVGQSVETEVNRSIRSSTALNHSATHLLHAALRKVLGTQVQQKGSVVDSARLRFDFSCSTPVSSEQIAEIEAIVSEQVRANTVVTTTVTSIDAARKMGAMALFGEKYGETVRVLCMGADNFSIELCGGTHVQQTGDIGQFVIVSEGSIASGIRRIEALTGKAAEEYLRTANSMMSDLASQLKCVRSEIADKVSALIAQNRLLEKQVDQLKGKVAASMGADLAQSAIEVKGVKVLSVQLEGFDRKSLMEAVDKLKNQLGSAVIVLAAIEEGKAVLIAGATKDICNRLPAGDLVRQVAAEVGGKGGGRPDMAQGGGDNIEALPNALKNVRHWVETRL